MQKIYSLLRSNKQSGPYALEELLRLNLKPLDLVWVEGKSAGWSYPTEIDALKMYVSAESKPTGKKEIASSIEPTSSPIIPITKTTDTYRANTRHIYISLPADKIISENTSAKQPGEIFEESPEAKLERKAQELRNKIQAFTEQKNAPKADNDLDTKYSRSLDDIKEEYSSWLYQQQKKKKNFPKKYLLSVACVSILLSIVYFSLPLFSAFRSNDSTVLATQNTNTSLPVSDNHLPEEKMVGSEKKTPGISRTSKKIKKNTPAIKPTRVYSNEEIDKVDTYLDSLKSASEKNTTYEETVYQPSSPQNDGSRQSVKRNSEPDPKQPSVQSENDSTPLTELVKLSESTGSGVSHLSLYNKSNKYIKFVAVDVYYYKANQKLLLKKTLYFNDISPNSSARLYLPQEKNAATVKYQMGLISTDKGLYYAKQ